MVKPAMLVFAAIMFAVEFGLYLPELIRFKDYEFWAATGIFLWGAVIIWLTWWTPRQLAGAATGQGRFWKWLGYTVGLGLASGLPVLIAGFVAGFGREDATISWSAAAAGAVLQISLLLAWVRLNAMAISGDRIRFSQIREGLAGHFANVLMLFAPAIAMSWAVDIGSVTPEIINSLDGYALAATTAAVCARWQAAL